MSVSLWQFSICFDIGAYSLWQAPFEVHDGAMQEIS